MYTNRLGVYITISLNMYTNRLGVYITISLNMYTNRLGVYITLSLNMYTNSKIKDISFKTTVTYFHGFIYNIICLYVTKCLLYII